MEPEDLEAAGADFRHAKAAVGEHVKRWADAEIGQVDWLKAHRGVPANELYDRQTGAPLDPELLALEAAVVRAEVDVQWCKALIVACGEVYKGQSFAEVIAAQVPRHEIDAKAARALAELEGDTQ